MTTGGSAVRLRRTCLLGAALLTALFAGLALVRGLVHEAPPAPAALPDPRISYDGPYRNVHPDVASIDDARCAQCHATIARHFRTHPMGRSLGPIDEFEPIENYGAEAHNPFRADGFEYRVRREKGEIVHEELKRGPDGEAVATRALAVRYALGSGARGRSYLIERDGFMLQSPISWFMERRRWDQSPGYAHTELHFERPVHAECLNCHSNHVEPVPGTVNRFAAPTFRGHAIGCQRCHGPGELHDRAARAGEANEQTTIVNPARLSPKLRDAVCEQCHLLGAERVPRMGLGVAAFRPGLPLEQFVAVFVSAGGRTDDARAVGQVEQLAQSRCRDGGGARLGCIACHDPHRLPAPGEKTAYYRARCVTCHSAAAAAVCARPAGQRAGADCINCHMPRRGSTDVAHLSVTDHRIRRHPAPPGTATARPAVSDATDLERFHPPTAAGDERDLGVALAQRAESGGRQLPAGLALPRLDRALEAQPNDTGALEARAIVRGILGRPEAALADLERLLRLTPRSERAHHLAAVFSGQRHDYGAAITHSRAAVAINPYRSEYHFTRAFAHLQRQEWSDAVEAAKAALALNPARLGPRRVLILALVELNRRAEARAELAIYRAFNPPDADDLARRLAK